MLKKLLFCLIVIACAPVLWFYTAPLYHGNQLVRVNEVTPVKGTSDNPSNNTSSNYEFDVEVLDRTTLQTVSIFTVQNVDSPLHIKFNSKSLKAQASSAKKSGYATMTRYGIRFPMIGRGINSNALTLTKIDDPAQAGAWWWLGWRTIPLWLINLFMVFILWKTGRWAYRKA